MQPVVMFGGTFDPVHHGHLRLAVELRERLGACQVHLIPNALPPHRARPTVSGADRLALLGAALEGEDALLADGRELERPGPSYSIDTLSELASEYPDRPLCLVVGNDAFAGLDRWHRWREIPSIAHIVVASRPGESLPRGGPVADLYARARLDQVAQLRERRAGGILAFEIPPLDISSSGLRERLRSGRSVRFLVPDRVIAMIEERGLYGRAQ
ncbi:MAG: nicotinate-nucleotide adenylyltransferase [Gammaproteobacteria bacterium]